MSFNRYARRVDISQGLIVEGLEKCGYQVRVLGFPVDLLVRHHTWPMNIWKLLEVKTPRNKANAPRLDKRQAEQAAFCKQHWVPYVTTVEQAIEALK